MFTEHFFNALSYHPDRLSLRFTRYEALWVAPSANAKNFNILQRKKSYDGSSLIWFKIMF
jgi:hypothetical protein